MASKLLRRSTQTRRVGAARASMARETRVRGEDLSLESDEKLATVDLSGIGGVGLVLHAKKGELVVQSIIKDGPVAINGMVKAGDVLSRVSGSRLDKDDIETVRDMVFGSPGTIVRLGFERLDLKTGRKFVFEINVNRESSDGNGFDFTDDDFESMQQQEELNASEISLLELQRSSKKNLSSPWPTPFSIRNKATAPIDVGEDGATPAELSLNTNKSSADPYSVLEKKKNEQILMLTSEIETLKNELTTCRLDLNEAKIRFHQEEEMKRIEEQNRQHEETLKKEAMERERIRYQEWYDEHQKNEEMKEEIRKLEKLVASSREESARQDSKNQEGAKEIERLKSEEANNHAAIKDLQMKLQDTRSRIAVLVESNHKLKEETSRRQNIESHNSSEIQHLRSSLSSAKSQLADSNAKVEELSNKLALREREYKDKTKEYSTWSNKWQDQIKAAETSNKKLKLEVETLSRKCNALQEQVNSKNAQLEKLEDSERALAVQSEKFSAEMKRLRALNDMLEKEMDKAKGEIANLNTQRKIDKTELQTLRSKLEDLSLDAESASSETEKYRMWRQNQEEREKKMQNALLESEESRRELDSRLWLLESRRKQDLVEFNRLREDYSKLEKENYELKTETRSHDKTRQDLDSQLSFLRASCEDASAKLAATDSENQLLRSRLQHKEEEMENVKAENELHESQIATLMTRIDDLHARLKDSEAEVLRHKSDLSKLSQEYKEIGEQQKVLTEEKALQSNEILSLHARISQLSAEIEDDKAKKISAEAREREVRQQLTVAQEGLRSLENKHEYLRQDHELISSQLSKLRHEHASALITLKEQTSEIDEAQRLLVETTNALEIEQSRRIALDEREKNLTTKMSKLENDKYDLEQKLWMLEEARGQLHSNLDLVRASHKAQEEDRVALLRELEKKDHELEEIRERSKELLSKFKLIEELKKEYEDVENERKLMDERSKDQNRELQEAKETARRAIEACNVLTAKGKQDEGIISQLNDQIVMLQEAQISSQLDKMSSAKALENTIKELQERLKATEDELYAAGMRQRKVEMKNVDLEQELARLRTSFEHKHAQELKKDCGLGVIFAKSGGGFAVAEVDGGSSPQLKLGDLIIAIDDTPVVDLSSQQFRRLLQGPEGSHLTALIVPEESRRGSVKVPTELSLTRRPWIQKQEEEEGGGSHGSPGRSGEVPHHPASVNVTPEASEPEGERGASVCDQTEDDDFEEFVKRTQDKVRVRPDPARDLDYHRLSAHLRDPTVTYGGYQGNGETSSITYT